MLTALPSALTCAFSSPLRWIVHHAYLVSVFFAVVTTPVFAQAPPQTFFPGGVPLAVRQSYLNAYVTTGNQSAYTVTWPVNIGNPRQIMGWTGTIRIDGANATFGWLGAIGTSGATVLDLIVTPTRTIWKLQAGPIMLNITFLSPIEPGDHVRQSIPFSYVAFEAASTDGKAHTVQVYTDATAEWVSGDRSAIVSWSTTVDTNNNIIYHSSSLQNQEIFTESAAQAQWGTLYYATQHGNGVTYRTGIADDNRAQFLLKGVLDNTQDTDFRAVTDDYPTYSFAYDLGAVQSTQNPIVFAIGFTRDPAIKYTDLSGASSQRSLYYLTNFTDTGSLINFVLNDYSGALTRAIALDNELINAASSAVSGSAYSDLISLTTRQVFGSAELTVGVGTNGQLNTSDVMMFVRNTNGPVSGRVNPVEGLYAAWPFFMYIDNSLGPALLEPLLRFQQSPSYQIQFAAQDLGSSYPNATASNDAHRQGVEQSANMIIMAYSHARISGDGRVIARYYDLFESWANYLVENTLFSTGQVDADGQTMANQTDLAIKGIIAIAAMEQISAVMQKNEAVQRFKNASATLYGQWKDAALGNSNRLLQVYNRPGTYSLGYNLFADKWLGLNVVDSDVYSGQSNLFQSLIAQNANMTSYGIATDNTTTDTVASSWNMFAAAFVPDTATQTALVNRIHNRAALNSIDDVMPVWYSSVNGVLKYGVAHPAIGAFYALLSLSLQPASAINVPAGQSSLSASKHSIVAPVVGGVVGGLAGVAAVVAAGFLVRRLYNRRRGEENRKRASAMLAEYSDRGSPNQELPLATPFPYHPPESRHDSSTQLHNKPLMSDHSSPEISPVPSPLQGGGGSFVPLGFIDGDDVDPFSSSVDSQSRTAADSLHNPWPRNQPMRAVNAEATDDGTTLQNPTPTSSVKLATDTRRAREPERQPIPSPGRGHDSETAQLRQEVMNLRQQMEELRAEHVLPPPRYDSV